MAAIGLVLLAGCSAAGAPAGDVVVRDDPAEGVTWYVPAGGSDRAIILLHGFGRDRSRMAGHARALAERGWTALAVDLVPLLGGMKAREENVRRTVKRLGRLARDHHHLALAGHSAGGAIAFRAAVQAQREGLPIRDLVLLDAVPGPREIELAKELKPLRLLSLTSPPCSLNLFGVIRRLHAAIPFPFTHVEIEGSSHVDPENPEDGRSLRFGTERGRREYARRLLEFLR